MRRLLLAVGLVVTLGYLGVAGSATPPTADEVIAITKAQWAAEMKKDLAGSMKNIADEYTEFNNDFPTRLDGKAINMHLGEASMSASGSLVAAEMANEKVQVYGDVAILSYNFIGMNKDKDGKVEPTKAKSTRVYVKRNGQWWLVHANFGQAN